MQSWRIPSLGMVLIAATHAVSVSAAQDVEIEARRLGDSVEIKAHAQLAAPAELVWRVLTDYERLPAFIPGLAKSVVRRREGNLVVVDQTGEARFLLFYFPIEVRYEVTEHSPQWVESRAVGGNLKLMNGRYDLEPGSEAATIRLRYHGFIEPDFQLPPLIGVAALRSMAEEQFTAMVAEIERRAAGGAPAGGAPK